MSNPPPISRSVFDPEPEPNPLPTVAHDLFEGEPYDEAPWVIEVPDDVPAGRTRARGPRRPDWFMPAVVAAVLVVAGLVSLDFLLSIGDGEAQDRVATGSTAITTTTEVDALDGPSTSTPPPTADASSTSASEPESTTTSEPTTTSSSTTGATTTTTTAPPPPTEDGPGGVPMLASSFEGGWVAQLASVPESASEEQLVDEWKKVRSNAPDAVATRSSSWSSLADGYWVFVHAGPFDTRDDAAAFCAEAGLGSNDCVARELVGRQ